ncbi:MAG: ureidoglycolate lyase [Pseudomonadota bacterium]
MPELILEPLTAEAFKRFGDVIEARGHAENINAGTTQKFADLAKLSLTSGDGRPALALYRAEPCDPQAPIQLLERHPLSSQAFIPMNGARLVIIVAPPQDVLDPSTIRAFLGTPLQGVNYHPGTWHHPSITWQQSGWLLVLDREGPEENCDLAPLDVQPPLTLTVPKATAVT